MGTPVQIDQRVERRISCGVLRADHARSWSPGSPGGRIKHRFIRQVVRQRDIMDRRFVVKVSIGVQVQRDALAEE